MRIRRNMRDSAIDGVFEKSKNKNRPFRFGKGGDCDIKFYYSGYFKFFILSLKAFITSFSDFSGNNPETLSPL